MTLGETMHRGRIVRRGAAAGALACALTISALAQERLKDPVPDRPKDRSPNGIQKGRKDQPSKPSQQQPSDRAKALPDRPNFPKPSDHLRLFAEAVAELEKSYVVKVDQRKLVEAAIRGMFKAFDARSEYVDTQGRLDHAKSGKDFDPRQVFSEAVAALEKNLEVKPDRRKLTEAAIRGMLKDLDARSEYFDAREFLELQKESFQESRGERAGVGTEIRLDGGRVQVLAVLPGTPAEREKLGAGDVITHIDGKDLSGFTLNEARRLLAGPPGSTVALKILPEGRGQPRDIELQRAPMTQASVSSSAELDVGYIRVSRFLEPTDTQLTNAVQGLRAKIGNKLKGFVIDLRNNTGGLLHQAVGSADVFLDRGLIVELRGREVPERHHHARPGDAAGGAPLIVLVNGGTSAGAEIMAAALQDHKRARLVGSRTAGIGTVRSILVLGSGIFGALILTTAHNYTPLGRALEGVGVEPDIPVERAGDEGPPGLLPLDKSRDAQLQRALSLLREGS